MGRYNYPEAVKNDILDYIRNELDLSDFNSVEELEEYLNDVLFCADSVTGNASGSYTCSTYEAEENICHNWGLLQAVQAEFGYGPELFEKDPEQLDVIIRCYLLPSAISEALVELDAAGELETLEAIIP